MPTPGRSGLQRPRSRRYECVKLVISFPPPRVPPVTYHWESKAASTARKKRNRHITQRRLSIWSWALDWAWASVIARRFWLALGPLGLAWMCHICDLGISTFRRLTLVHIPTIDSERPIPGHSHSQACTVQAMNVVSGRFG